MERLDLPECNKVITLGAILFLTVLTHLVSEKIYAISRENSELRARIHEQKDLFHHMHHFASHVGERNMGLEEELEQIALLNERWSQNHFAFQFGTGALFGNSNTLIKEKFNQIEPYKDGISDAVKEFLLVVNNDHLKKETVKKICAHESSFLGLMNEIEQTFIQENDNSIAFLQKLNVSILIITVVFIIFIALQLITLRIHLAFPTSMRNLFSNTLVEEYLNKLTAHGGLASEKDIFRFSEPTILSEEKVKLLVIKDKEIPIDYIAWFLNQCAFEFNIAKDVQAAERAIDEESYDALIISHALYDHWKSEIKFLARGQWSRLPLVVLEVSDICEIHTHIHADDLVHTSSKKGVLYQKIAEKIALKKIKP
ncbi:hypothetical protein [Catalinimonas alkaloidigena]|uniref:hypothetical protein n=1 Tax=Catalinimonas alkaloidigena TaxID=1075417 RepID=UPI00240750E6|nr:hypothetical protein [Catalinimonas alkaloidigena]